MWLAVVAVVAVAARGAEGQDCYCSGVATQCREATSHYWATLRLEAAPEDHGFRLTDKEQGEEALLEYKPDTRELSHRYPRGTGRASLYYWALPEKMMGSRVAAYGGNLTFYQRFIFSGDAGMQDADVILVGEEMSVQTQVAREGLLSGQEERSRVTLSERGWVAVRDGVPGQATKADFLKVLAGLRAILVRGTYSLTMQETMLRKVMMDISVPQRTGGPRARGLEECRCPPQYRGLSCEECAPGHTDHPACRPLPGLGSPPGPPGASPGAPDPYRPPPGAPDPYGPPPGAPDPYGPPPGAPDPYGTHPGAPDPYGPSLGAPDPYGSSPGAPPPGSPYRPSIVSGVEPDPYAPSPGAPYGPPGAPDPYGPSPGAPYGPPAAPGLAPGEAPLEVSISGPRLQTVRPGDTATFDCSAKPRVPLRDPLTYGWAKQNGLLPPGRSREDGYGMLVISSVETDDTGTYVCTVTAGAFRVQESLELAVAEEGAGPATVTVSESYQEVLAGEDAMFDCWAEGGGAVSWRRGSDWSLSERARAAGSRLQFLGVQVADEGEYVCEGPGGGLARAQLYVQEGPPWPGGPRGRQRPRGPPRGPPRPGPRPPPAPACTAPTVTIEPTEQTVPQGEDASLECRASPPGGLQWMKVGEELSSPQLTVAGGRVEVRAAAVTDRGMYVCTVTTACGSARASSILEVEPREAPVVELYPGPSQTVTAGESVLFQCRYLAGIPGPTIAWGREDGRPLPPSAELLPGGVLRIDAVSPAEAGRYRCIATNVAGTVQALASLAVQQPPAASLRPSGAVTVVEGSPLTVECTVTAGDPPPTIAWRRIGARTEPVGRPGPTLSLPAVTKAEEGTYACVASNAAGEAEERIQVLVTRRPEAPRPATPSRRRPGEQARGEHEVHTRIGSNITLNCLTGEYVPPGARAVWTRSSRSRPFSRRHDQQDGLLQIRGVKSSDHGLYKCQLIAEDNSVLFELRANLIVKPRIGTGTGSGRHGSRNPFNWAGGSPPPAPAPPRAPAPPPEEAPWGRGPGGEAPEEAPPWARGPGGEAPEEAPPWARGPGPKLQVTVDPPEREVAVGELAEFHCTAVALVRLQEPTTLTWVREGAALPAGRGEDRGDGHLHIQGARLEDTGTYVCFARSGAFLQQAQASLLVTLATDSDPGLERQPLNPRAYQPRPYQPESPYQQAEMREPEERYSTAAKGYQPPVSPYRAPSKGYPQPYQEPAKGYQPPSQGPVQPYQPQAPGQPYQPQAPGQPYQPQGPVQPYQPQSPGQPYHPQSPGQPYQPQGPVQPYQPQSPSQPYQPGQRERPGQPYQPQGPGQREGADYDEVVDLLAPDPRYPPVGPSGAAPGDYGGPGSGDYGGEEDEYGYPGEEADYGNPAPWEENEVDDYYEDDGRSPIAFSSEDYRGPRGPAGGPRQYQPYSGGQWAGGAVWGGCRGGEVQCGALEECILAETVCDGEYDCTDGWDELTSC